MQIALVTHSKKVTDYHLAFIAEAVNAQVVECARAWGAEPTPVTFYSSARDLPARNCRIMDVVDAIDVPGAAGYHTSDAGIVYGRVLARSFLDTGITISHEALEMLIDPSAAEWRAMPDGFAVAKEVCDPVQGDVYPASIDMAGVQEQLLLSNYVYPRWFTPGATGQLDRLGRVGEAFGMTAGGYMIVRDPSGKQGNRWARFGGDRARAELGAKFANPDARLARRLFG